jgi:hypothetical protein
MANAMLDARQEDGAYRRDELITGRRRRRRWTADSGRYASSTKRVYLCCVAHFAHWLTRKNCPLDAINEKVVDQFVLGHLSRCRCPDPVRRVDYENKAALARLLEVLRVKGGIPDRLSLNDHIGHELVQFDGHMCDVEGLALNTRRQRCHIIRRFLVKQFGSRPIDLSKVGASAVRRFVLGEDCDWTPGTIRWSAVRSHVTCDFEAFQAAKLASSWWPFPELPIGRWRLCRRCSPTPRSNNCCGRLIDLLPPIDAPTRWCAALPIWV